MLSKLYKEGENKLEKQVPRRHEWTDSHKRRYSSHTFRYGYLVTT